jgi:hypothetical protein
MLRRIVVLCLLAVAFAAGAPLVSAGVGDHKCTDCNKVYYGNPRLFKAPCEISADRVYKHIKEYKEILEKGLTDKDVQYHFLMKKASERFNDAVKQMAKDEGFDLVAETGTVKKAKDDAKDAPDRTDDVIKNL